MRSIMCCSIGRCLPGCLLVKSRLSRLSRQCLWQQYPDEQPRFNVTITNSSQKDIRHVYVAVGSPDNWGPDRGSIQQSPLAALLPSTGISCDGSTVRVIAEDQNGCFYYNNVSCDGTPRGQYRTARLLTAEVSVSASISRQSTLPGKFHLKWRCLQGAFPIKKDIRATHDTRPISSCVELPVTVFRESFTPVLETTALFYEYPTQALCCQPPSMTMTRSTQLMRFLSTQL